MTEHDPHNLQGTVAANWRRVSAQVAAAAAASGRDPAAIRVVAVTKTHPNAVVEAAVAAGLTDFGENRVQDLVSKKTAFSHVQWHFIGQLQRNKVRHVVDGNTLIHSVDRTALVDAIQRHAAVREVVQPVLVQVNVGDDPAKGGCEIKRSGELVAYAQQQANIRVEGLMTVPPLPPATSDPAIAAREHFAALRELRDVLQEADPRIVELSMGMTADFETAIEEGATMVRIGTALFGQRSTPPHVRMEEQQ